MEDDTVHGAGMRDERAGREPGGKPKRVLPGPAAGVVDGHHLAGAEEELADGQRPDLIAGDNTARVADDVSLTPATPRMP